MTAPSTDPMEDFLAREKAALEALEAVEIENDNVMQVDEPVEAPNNASHPTSPRPVASYIASPTANTRVTSPTTPKTKVETAAMKEWKTERARQIAERDASAVQMAGERSKAAKRDLEEWRVKYKEDVAGRKTGRSEQEVGRSEWDGEKKTGKVAKEQVDWRSILALMEALPKPSKDCSRLLGIVKSLAE
ncbi:putative Vesicle coat protein clathrin, light chain [Paramicrosporidium saccamoebae]|uniref:Clathrin light chain n=1 Tax=Paramicrosporidium saccamoebae TaxID=1246581 RepID=A0A2H9THJ1_9FUNG|nr:putative Vesicle coat protein clathrin, light chain [Paramicrosporidium saccamoebae]